MILFNKSIGICHKIFSIFSYLFLIFINFSYIFFLLYGTRILKKISAKSLFYQFEIFNPGRKPNTQNLNFIKKSWEGKIKKRI